MVVILIILLFTNCFTSCVPCFCTLVIYSQYFDGQNFNSLIHKQQEITHNAVLAIVLGVIVFCQQTSLQSLFWCFLQRKQSLIKKTN